MPALRPLLGGNGSGGDGGGGGGGRDCGPGKVRFTPRVFRRAALFSAPRRGAARSLRPPLSTAVLQENKRVRLWVEAGEQGGGDGGDASAGEGGGDGGDASACAGEGGGGGGGGGSSSYASGGGLKRARALGGGKGGSSGGGGVARVLAGLPAPRELAPLGPAPATFGGRGGGHERTRRGAQLLAALPAPLYAGGLVQSGGGGGGGGGGGAYAGGYAADLHAPPSDRALVPQRFSLLGGGGREGAYGLGYAGGAGYMEGGGGGGGGGGAQLLAALPAGPQRLGLLGVGGGGGGGGGGVDPVLRLGLTPAAALAFTRQLAVWHAATTATTSPIARRLAALQERQARAVGGFVAAADGGPPGYASTCGGAGGLAPLHGRNPVIAAANYHSPGAGKKDLDMNGAVKGFALAPLTFGHCIGDAAAAGGARIAAPPPPQREEPPQPPHPQHAGLGIFGGGAFFDASPLSVNRKGSNASPAKTYAAAQRMGVATPLQRTLAAQGGEFWGEVIAGALAGEVDFVVVNGKEQALEEVRPLLAGVPSTNVTAGFLALMEEEARLRCGLVGWDPDLGFKGAAAIVYELSPSQLLLIAEIEHASNAAYGRGCASMARYTQRALILGLVLAWLATGAHPPLSAATSAAMAAAGGDFTESKLSKSELGQGGKAVVVPRKEALRVEAEARRLRGGGDEEGAREAEDAAETWRKQERAAQKVKSDSSRENGAFPFHPPPPARPSPPPRAAASNRLCGIQ